MCVVGGGGVWWFSPPPPHIGNPSMPYLCYSWRFPQPSGSVFQKVAGAASHVLTVTQQEHIFCLQGTLCLHNTPFNNFLCWPEKMILKSHMRDGIIAKEETIKNTKTPDLIDLLRSFPGSQIKCPVPVPKKSRLFLTSSVNSLVGWSYWFFNVLKGWK